MKNFSFLLAVVLLVWLSHSQFGQSGIGIVGPLTSSAFACLNNTEPLLFLFIRVYHSVYQAAGIDANAEMTLLNAKKSQNPSSYIEICRKLNPISQVTEVIDFINTVIPGQSILILVKFVENEYPGCQWAGFTPKQNCDFITEVMDTIQSLSFVGFVFTTSKFWADHLGSECADFGNSPEYSLFYANYQNDGHVNSDPSFSDFQPFAGWSIENKNILGKQIYGNHTLPLTCLTVGSYTPQALVDVYST